MLRRDVLPGIGRVRGYKGAQLLGKNYANETEFITITYFYDLNAIISFAGEDYAKAVIHKEAGKLLTHYDERSVHYDLAAMIVTEDFISQVHKG
jgi:heme-degrading monooxygenase HmoA